MKDTRLLNSNPYHHSQAPDFKTPNFIDQAFPPQEKSIIYIDQSKSVSSCITEEDTQPLKGLIWHRPKEIFRGGKYKIFEKMDIEDIHQGVLGNCYFLSSLSAIAEYPGRLAKLIQNKTTSENGCYAINVFIQGKQKTVLIDDEFPVFKNKNWAMASSGEGEIWVQLFEKVWAKINSSYTMTIAGLPSEALSTLTEAPVITYIHKKYEPDQLFDIFKNCDDQKFIICTTTNSSSASKEVGLVQSHAYTVISCYNIDGLKLMKIRNPWGGGFEWNGDFGDHSKLWTPELKKKVEYVKADDGIFYMTFNDFLKYYPYTFVCKYYDGFYYKYKKLVQHDVGHMMGIKFVVNKPTKAIIGLHQKQERFYNKVKNYKPCYCKLFLVKKTDNNMEYIQSNEGSLDKIYLDLDNLLQPGEYYIFGKIMWNYFEQDKCSVVFSLYSNNKMLDFLPIDRSIIQEDYLTKVFDSFIDQRMHYKPISGTKCSYVASLSDTDTGFFWLSFKNMNPLETAKITFTVAMNEFLTLFSQGIKVKRVGDNYHYEVTVPPNSRELVLFETLDNIWCCKIGLSPLSVEFQSYSYDPEVDRKYIRENLSKAVKDPIIEKDVYYALIKKGNGLLIVLQNVSDNEYMIRSSLNNMANCSIAYPFAINTMNIKLAPKSFDFIRVVPNNFDKIGFKFVYSYKNTSKEMNIEATKENVISK